MRALFIPYPDGIPSHGIPLLALNRICDRSTDTAFLLPRAVHNLGRQADVEVLNYDFTGTLATELEAYNHFHPDVVVDDCNPATFYATAMARLPRVTVLRIGAFPGYQPLNPQHIHTLPIVDRVSRWISPTTRPPTISELCTSTVHIIPSVPTIEQPTRAMIGNQRYIYSGPLTLPDDWTMRLMMRPERAADVWTGLYRFLKDNEGQQIAFMTFGVAQASREEGRSCVRQLIGRGVAVISTFSAGELDARFRKFHYWAELLPIHQVCAKAALMIHQCGSGTYSYPLVHAIPTVTVGTGHFDREDVAIRLQELGVSTHIVPQTDERRLATDTVNAACGWLDGAGATRFGASIQALEQEVSRVSRAFCLNDALELAVNLGPTTRPDLNFLS